jgi:adenine-specific DNA-methyltransferase
MVETEPGKLDLRSMNITEEQKSKLKQVFPHIFNEDKIDFDKLRQTLGEEVDEGQERYGMTWPGKSECFNIIQQPSTGTLKPCREESVNFDETENLFIEGDNLEALKILQKSYYGKIKMIYIDPPYNTGKEFIYPDKYSETLDTYLAYTGQISDDGIKFSTNTEAEGRFHSKWLNMMYPRLFLARNLLREDGVISISIDDNEVDNSKKGIVT